MKVSAHSQRLNIGEPILPMYLPVLRSRRHPSTPVSFIRKTEITFILMSKEGWKALQEAWLGSENFELKRSRNHSSVSQCHFGSLPKERDGMSVMAFSVPAMCRGVSDEVPLSFILMARAYNKSPATSELFDAIRWTK